MSESETVVWLDRRTFLLLHQESLATFGGLEGLRDQGLLESALARPEQIAHYRSDVTLAELAAAYAYGLARNHPFFDGNKRAAFLALTLLCEANGLSLRAAKPEAIAAMMMLAAGELTEEQLTAWVSEHLIRLEAAP